MPSDSKLCTAGKIHQPPTLAQLVIFMFQVLFHYAINFNTPFVVAVTTFSELRDKTEDELEVIGCAFRRNPPESAGIRRNLCKKGPSGKNVKVRSTEMCYNTILDIPVRSSWYLSTWFLHVDKSCTYSK